ncbi:hypothetical protein PR003_g32323 [Phytophthora rubi]|nr:hypothetical protein PR001_g30340 [Phytophthora rubi]KAE9265863.1 hypothetical protein PR003_g32323 [Phytophthora rubi]
MHDDDFTNMIIIGAMERRDRLDVVHARLHLECLDSAPYDIAILERGLGAEAARLQDLAGQIGALDRDRVKSQEQERAQPVEARAPISAHLRHSVHTKYGNALAKLKCSLRGQLYTN